MSMPPGQCAGTTAGPGSNSRLAVRLSLSPPRGGVPPADLCRRRSCGELRPIGEELRGFRGLGQQQAELALGIAGLLELELQEVDHGALALELLPSQVLPGVRTGVLTLSR